MEGLRQERHAADKIQLKESWNDKEKAAQKQPQTRNAYRHSGFLLLLPVCMHVHGTSPRPIVSIPSRVVRRQKTHVCVRLHLTLPLCSRAE